MKLKMPGRIVVFQRFPGHFAYLSVKREILYHSSRKNSSLICKTAPAPQRPSTYVSLKRTKLFEQLHTVLCALHIEVLAFMVGNQIGFFKVIGKDFLLFLR